MKNKILGSFAALSLLVIFSQTAQAGCHQQNCRWERVCNDTFGCDTSWVCDTVCEDDPAPGCHEVCRSVNCHDERICIPGLGCETRQSCDQDCYQKCD